jgi:hypothetical protein
MGMVSENLGVTKLVDLSVMAPEHLSLYFYNFFVICYAFLKFTTKLSKTYIQTLERKRKITTGSFTGLLHNRILPVVFC